MNFNKTTLFFLLSSIFVTGIVFITCYKNEKYTIQTPVKKCECGPTEHWFFKSCIKNYNKQFPDVQLPEDNDTEGLSENILQAIDMFALDMNFIDENGQPLNPELNKAGNHYLPLFKNPKFMLCKQVLRNVDTTTTLSAQELYEQWAAQLNELK